MTSAQVQQVIDAVFGVLEQKEGPVAKAVTEVVRKSVDANLAEILTTLGVEAS